MILMGAEDVRWRLGSRESLFGEVSESDYYWFRERRVSPFLSLSGKDLVFAYFDLRTVLLGL